MHHAATARWVGLAHFARCLQAVDDVCELRLHRQRLDLIAICFRVQVALNFSGLGVEQAKFRRRHGRSLLRHNLKPAVGTLCDKRHLLQAVTEGQGIEALAHWRAHVARRIRLLGHEYACILVEARVVHRAVRMYMEIARVPHPPAIPKAHVDAVRGRHERRERGRRRGRRRRSKPTALLTLQGFVLIQRDNHEAEL